MSLIVRAIVGGVNEQNSIVNIVCVDDWATESAIKATNEIIWYGDYLLVVQRH